MGEPLNAKDENVNGFLSSWEHLLIGIGTIWLLSIQV
jgi:hypothetical protein